MDYQKNRIINFLNPTKDLQGSGWNAYQSVIASGSGGFLGKGVGYGTQSRLGFLPEHETDFIFASFFLEEWGMIGGLIVFILFTTILLILQGRRVLAIRISKLFYHRVIIWFASAEFI